MKTFLVLVLLLVAGCGGSGPTPALSPTDFTATKAWAEAAVRGIREVDTGANAMAIEAQKETVNKQLKALVGKKVSWEFKVFGVSKDLVELETEFTYLYKRAPNGEDVYYGYLTVTFDGEQGSRDYPISERGVSPQIAASLKRGDTLTVAKKVKSAKVVRQNGWSYIFIDLDVWSGSSNH